MFKVVLSISWPVRGFKPPKMLLCSFSVETNCCREATRHFQESSVSLVSGAVGGEGRGVTVSLNCLQGPTPFLIDSPFEIYTRT